MNEFQQVLEKLLETRVDLAIARRERDEFRLQTEKQQAEALPNRGDVVLMLSAMASDKKIEAIRYCRALTGYGLKEAKDMIEAALSRNAQS